jgi:FMN-dependent NADH-azoreductase
LSAEIINVLRRTLSDDEVTRRDLELEPLPHLDSKMLAAMWPDNEVDEATRSEIAKSEAVLEEFLRADVAVIGAPMYNFTVPTQLKVWIDRIVIAGRTFRYTQTGAIGLVGGKKVIVASSRGGNYESGGPLATLDFQEVYLRTVFQFLGIKDLEFVRAEGTALGPKQRAEAILAAFESVPACVARVVAALEKPNPGLPSESDQFVREPGIRLSPFSWFVPRRR